MSVESLIEWTDSTWNFLLGCFYKSPGCLNCYAVWTCWRLAHNPNPKIAAAYAGLVRKTGDGRLVWTGKVNLVEERLTLPLLWKKPRKIFVNSQSDLFHESVSFDVIDRAFAVMALCPQHTFQILTKRPDRMREYLKDEDDRIAAIESWAGEFGACHVNIENVPGRWPLPNVWLGTSVENQKAADLRIPDLLATPAAVRFLSCEPLLGPVDLNHVRERLGEESFQIGSAIDHSVYNQHGEIDWVIVGGESGPNARPMHPDWARSLRDQCGAAGVPFFFKQWGEWAPNCLCVTDKAHKTTPRPQPGKPGCMFRCGKDRAGRELDGREWNEMPGIWENVQRPTPNVQRPMVEA